jgi:2-polyprenyl-3-methyl-5-hydroxy-6-metoxy-1,4-benzoquinol methylase
VIDYVQPQDLDRGIKFIKGSIEDAGVLEALGDKRFDIVTAFQVIEHCRHPKLVVEHLVRLCAENGYIIIATPLVNSFSERNALGKTSWFYPPEHINLISHDGMKRMFASYDCTLVTARRYELNILRWIARYGLAYYEGFRGLIVKKLCRKVWTSARGHKTSKVQELVFYVFQRKN